MSTALMFTNTENKRLATLAVTQCVMTTISNFGYLLFLDMAFGNMANIASICHVAKVTIT